MRLWTDRGDGAPVQICEVHVSPSLPSQTHMQLANLVCSSSDCFFAWQGAKEEAELVARRVRRVARERQHEQYLRQLQLQKHLSEGLSGVCYHVLVGVRQRDVCVGVYVRVCAVIVVVRRGGSNSSDTPILRPTGAMPPAAPPLLDFSEVAVLYRSSRQAQVP
jgi:hypothetical protein